MSAAEQFFDTNILLYVLSGDDTRADRAEQELSAGGVVSVQVLNEFASVATRKLKLSFSEIRELLATFRSVCTIVPISEQTHDIGLQIAEKHGLTVYDAIIVASALIARCTTLVSEDMQHGQLFDGRLKVRNPFQ